MIAQLRRFISGNRYSILLLVLSSFALTPLLAPGYFFGAHDGRHSVFYLTMFDAAIRDGALWPRWAMHHIQGYGYPTFIIQAPLGFYVAELFVLLGAGYTLAAKLTWALGFYLSGWGLYRLVRHWLDRAAPLPSRTDAATVQLAAVAAGLIYVYMPYHLAGIYVRAALNDTLLLAWFPWTFLAFDRLIADGARTGWAQRLALAVLCLAGTLLTRTFALISFTPLLVTFVLFRLWLAWRMRDATEPLRARWAALGRRTLLAGGAGVLALLLCAAFILPLLIEGQHLEDQVYTTNTYDYSRHFVYFGQFFSPVWGFGFSDDPNGVNDGMGFQVGVLGLLLGIAAIYLLWRNGPLPASAQERAHRHNAPLMAYLVLISLLLLFVMTPAAAPLWDAFAALAIIQFPWRLLSLTAFTCSALAGLTLWWIWRSVTTLERPPDVESGVSGLLLFTLLAVLASSGYIQARLEPIEPWREDGRAVFRFEREHPDMIAYTEWVEEHFTETAMTPDYAAEAYRETDAMQAYGAAGALSRLAVLDGAGQVLRQYSRGSSAGGVVRMAEPGTVRLHVYYFPGWRVEIDGEPVAHRVSDPHGVIEVDVPAGEHRIDARMGATPIRRLGMIVSYAALLSLAGLWLFERWQVRRRVG